MDGRFLPNLTFGPDVVAARAGADVFCAGSALFSGPGTMSDHVTALRDAAVAGMESR